METYNALEMLVLPVVRGVGGALAFLALIQVIRIGWGLAVRQVRHRLRMAAEVAGRHRAAPARGDRPHIRVAQASR